MKKGLFMIAAVSMLAMVSTACKASDKADKDEDTAVSVIEDKAEAVDDAADEVPLPETAGTVDADGYKTTPSGLRYRVLREGEGKQPAGPDALVKVHYEGKLLDGTVFDSSYERGEPVEFPLNRVIPGWTEGVQLMKEGAKYEFLIPSALAYGKRGTPGGPIGPDEDLYFVVELLEVK